MGPQNSKTHRLGPGLSPHFGDAFLLSGFNQIGQYIYIYILGLHLSQAVQSFLFAVLPGCCHHFDKLDLLGN